MVEWEIQEENPTYGDVFMEIYNISNNNLLPATLNEMKKNPQNHYWMIAEPEEIQKHNDFFKFHPTTIIECQNPKQHPRLEVYDNISFGVLNLISHNGSWFEAHEVNFFIAQNLLVLISRKKNKLIEQIKSELMENERHTESYTINESKILFMLMDRLTSMDNVLLKKIEASIATLEEKVIGGEDKDFTAEIIHLRKKLLFLKRHYEPLIDIAEGLEENENGLIDNNAIRYFTILSNRMQRLNNNVLNLRDYITQVREAYQAQVDIKLNKTMKLFTVITTIFLPLTLIAGWYGMNFKYMPELSWVYGYPFVMAISLLVVVVCLVYFKRHNYL
jgi:magnesium transporter